MIDRYVAAAPLDHLAGEHPVKQIARDGVQLAGHGDVGVHIFAGGRVHSAVHRHTLRERLALFQDTENLKVHKVHLLECEMRRNMLFLEATRRPSKATDLLHGISAILCAQYSSSLASFLRISRTHMVLPYYRTIITH
jgi:hypothetical protein